MYANYKVMDNYDDILNEFEPLFHGDEWYRRKISTGPYANKEVKSGNTDLKANVDQFIMIDQKYHKEAGDDDDVVKQENDVEIQKSEINLLDSQSDDEVIKKKRETPAIESSDEPLVAIRTNPRRAHGSAIDPSKELIRGKSEKKKVQISKD
ncbi:hypothetical protein HAX54_032871 [Datura stramonium]|uniref:Uncharacterized protein n=1 Tax=Datura stramonium TaxID=4076 RepID=A0ABS8RLH2_DATST|nr:hypothetical protein [Datura stramonium]